MKAQTAIGSALQRAGFGPNHHLFHAIGMALQKNEGNKTKAASSLWMTLSGSKELAAQAMTLLIDAALDREKELLGVGLGGSAGDGPTGCADAQQTERGGPSRLPVPSGQTSCDKPPRHLSGGCPPSRAQNLAVESAKNVVAMSILDRQKTRGGYGKPWGNVYYHELETMSDDGALASEVKAYVGHKRGDDRLKQLRELITPSQFHSILRKAGVKAA